MKILREVLIEDRLPNEVGIYHCKRITGDDVVLYFNPDKTHYITKFKHKVEYWYEEVDLELKSEEILPENYRLSPQMKSKLNARYHLESLSFPDKQILLYHKALEAAELEIAELKDSKSAVRSNKKYLEQTVLKEFSIRIKELEEDLHKEKSLTKQFFKDEAIRLNKEIELLNKDAKERYNYAYDYYVDNVFDKGYELFHTEINKALKIASGINK